MTQNQFITVREAAQILAVSEKKVMDLIDQKKLQAYRIADKFLRLKKSEALALRNSGKVIKENVAFSYTNLERTKDFFYYNDFYLISFLIIGALVFIIFYT